ncbi:MULTISPECIES: FtsX-like permease family protein [unclassified Streptomyces]|uniref:FtsX-like permease family protein n=1 Tax=unclassified Streptomyces TaxID=2593676 RepID=UPI000DAD7957|nr:MULTISPECIES: FtsX-like permease family protein [unclassified Streptomyces]PZT72811.1 ABC transporter permease [Streptomyces sp. AC1-42T]PZT80871.1 ABC transporter permease [Streptomyces sp. AC1-42W]
MSVFTGWRAALRIARRDALRAKGRSALVVAMIALPVLGVTAADITFRSADLSPAEQLTARIGAADALFNDAGMGPVEQMPDGNMYNPVGEMPDEELPPIDMRAAFPRGARAISEQSVPGTVTTAYGIASVEIIELKTSDRMARGKIDLLKGAFPRGTGEMVATEPFLESAGLRVGSDVTVTPSGRKYTITGAVELPADLEAKLLYAEPGAVIAPWQKLAEGDKKVPEPHPGQPQWLVEMPGQAGVGWQDVLAANKAGAVVSSRQVFENPPARSEIPLLKSYPDYDRVGSGGGEAGAAAITVVAMALLEIVLLAGPAFAVGARRSRRQLGLLGTCGGDRSQVRAVVLGGGLVLGGAGAVAGVAAGLLLTVVFRPMIEGWAGHRFGSLVIRPTELLVIAVLGLVTGLLAALAPAIVAGRQSVLESLTGRRGVRRSSRVLPVTGACVLALGVFVAVYGGTSGDSMLVAGGSVVAEIGLLACIPVIVGLLGRLGRGLPLSPRMALRDAARNRGRTAPAVAAVMAAVAGSVAIATYMASNLAESDYDYMPMLTEGTISLSAGDAESAARLPVARAAVEHNMAVTGRRADVSRVWAGSDCNIYYEEEDSCGSMELVKPVGKGHTCPLDADGAKELAARLSADEHRAMMRTPACVDVRVSTSSFNSDANNIVVADAAFLDTYVKLHDPAAAAALKAGTPVLLNEAYAENGEVTLKAVHRYNDKDTKNRELHPGPPEKTTDRLKVYVAKPEYATTPGVRMILPQPTAERLGLHTEPYGSVYTVGHAPTDEESQRVSAAIDQAGGGLWVQTNSGANDRGSTILLILTLFAGVVTMGAAAITTGLAKADAEADLTTLSAVGAPPHVRRSLSGFQCLVVALTGVLLGTAAGLVPAVALRLVDLREAMKQMRITPMESAYTPIVVPWATIGLLAVAVPLLAGVLAAVFTRSRSALSRRAG